MTRIKPNRTHAPRRSCAWGMAVLTLSVLCFASSGLRAQVITVPKPGERDFIADQADLIAPADEQNIRTNCSQLLTDTATPIIVVTVESMVKYNNRGIDNIQTFAKVLFDQWGIGHLTVNSQPSNRGILIVVSRDDRKARIELGIGWPYEAEATAQQIMNDTMVPRFRAGDYSGGIVAGVKSLEQMTRAINSGGSASGQSTGQPGGGPLSSPTQRVPSSSAPSWGGGGGTIGVPCCGSSIITLIVIFFVIRMIGGLIGGLGGRRGAYRRGPGLGTGLLGGLLLGNLLGGRRSSSWGAGGSGFGGGGGFGGGFGGGGFGGGFSGGRGASGSW
jgi:uncharacterized protein